MLDVITALAWRQHGAFSRSQAIDLGVDDAWINRALRSGTIVRRATAVYTLTCAPRTWRQTLVIHVLAAGGALATSDSALALWSPELDPPRRPIVAAPNSCGYSSPQARIIRSRDLHLAKAYEIDGIPVVGVARALLDASVGRTADQVEGLINACQRHSSLAIGALTECLHDHARQGRPGIATFRAAIRKLTREVPDSEFERLVIRDLVDAGVPEPRLHHLVRIPGEKPIELDLDWPGLCLDVELDGKDHVKRAEKARRDRRRDRLLHAEDYVVLRYGWDEYLGDRDGMIAEIAGWVERGPR